MKWDSFAQATKAGGPKMTNFKLPKKLLLTITLSLLSVSPQSFAQTTFFATNPAVFYTPENWIQYGGVMMSNCPGAYLKVAFTGTSLAVLIDSSAYANRTPGVTHDLPKLGIQVDGGAVRTLVVPQIGVSVSVPAVSGLSPGTHQIRISLDGLGKDERWTNPLDELKIRGLVGDTGSSLSRPTLLSKRMVVYGDSITEGADALGRDNTVANKQWSVTWNALLAAKLNAEVSVIAYQAQGYHNNGQGNVPPFSQSYNQIQSGSPRIFSAPDSVFILQGTNGGASTSEVLGMMNNLRRAYPRAKLVFVVPFGGYARDAITSSYQSQHLRDPNLYLVDLGSNGEQFVSANSVDGIHPTVAGHASLAEMIYQQVQRFLPAIL